MSMFDGLLGNLDDIAAKLGLPADQVQGMMASVQEKMAGGGDMMSAVMSVAREHGISMDSLSGLLQGGGAQDMLSQVTGALDKDGDGNPLNDLGGLAKGLFGKE
jgi:hypothetical protein